jgi:hypothetical protein
MTMPDTGVTIREFEPGDEVAFRRLNEEWIIRYFALEAKDVETLTDPRGRFWTAAAESSLRRGEVRSWAAAPWWLRSRESLKWSRWR